MPASARRGICMVPCHGAGEGTIMRDSYDVVIIGGGVIGSSVAYHLSADAGFKGRVAVIERDPSYTVASSSLSTSAIRQQFGTAPNIRMSAYSIEFLRNVKALLAVDGYDAEIGLREPGYLILGTPGQIAGFEAKNAVQRACGIRTDLLDPAALQRRYPWLRCDDLGIASYGPEKEGWFDGPALLQAFRRKARAQGVTYIADSVVGIDMGAGAVQLAGGARLSAGVVVCAAGAWSGGIARMAGLDVPIVPRKRSVFVFDSPLKILDGPFIFDTSGLFLRPEGHLYLCGITPPTENADDDFGLEVDYSQFDELIWPALAHRVPGFEQLRMLRAWAGLYEYNLFDHSAIIGPHPDRPRFIFACGFSGHGMMHSPAAGAGVSELIVAGQSRSVDLAPFAYERIAANRPIQEQVY
jgi:FAD-dependent oxidoreductase domain-containing protein 1